MSQTAEVWTASDAPALPPPRRRGWGRFVAWAFFFVAGAAAGAMGAVIVVNHRMDERIKHSDRWPTEMVDSMRRELDLSEEQTEQVNQIVRAHREKIDKIWSEVRPQFREALKTMSAQVDGVLSADQQEKWHAWLETRRRRVCPNAAETSPRESNPSTRAPRT